MLKEALENNIYTNLRGRHSAESPASASVSKASLNEEEEDEEEGA